MVAYYFYNLVMYVVSRFGLKSFFVLFLLSYPFFLYLLPETGYDFAHYQLAYESVFFEPNAPLFFRSGSPLTAEPGWFLYTGLVSFITSDFRTFLAINFGLTMVLTIIAFRKFGLKDEYTSQIIALMIPVQFLIIYFWSPRSSLPLGFTFLFLAYLRKGNFILAVLFAVAATMIHSQYGLFIIFCGLYYGVMLLIEKNRNSLTRVSLPVIAGISVVTITMALMITSFISYLDFIPSYELINSKTRYLSVESEGFRATSILSLVFFPALLAIRWKDLSTRKEFDVVVIFVIFSFVVNAVFFYNTHLAGRLGRVSDYFLFGYFIVEFSRMIAGRNNALVVLFILLIFPFLFADLYPLSDFF
ncbi:EpsG family protein [Sphingopyxis sp. J-6]|uniref:EpsG family protein n=1 Tax=Sphingopyxis sp. J-6 TaxID=3122054 RepID=UPI0039840D5E